MNWFKSIKRDTLLYSGLMITFIILYGATAFVSFYHAVDLFLIGNTIFLAIILSFVAEIGQASALFSILLTKNKHKILTWSVMIILTTLQVIGNVFASYDFIEKHNSAGVSVFQRAILFFMPSGDPEIFKVIIAWILGALLPIIALSMTALVAQNMILRAEEARTKLDEDYSSDDSVDAKDLMSEVSKVRLSEDELSKLSNLLDKKSPIEKVPYEEIEIPLVNGTSLVDMGKLVVDGKVNITEEEKKTSNSSSEITIDDQKERLNELYASEPHEDLSKVFNKESEEVPPPDQLTNEEVKNSLLGIEFTPSEDVLPSYSDEEINEMNQDEYERTGTYDALDEEVDRLAALQSEEEVKKVISEVGDPPIVITHLHGLVDGIEGAQHVDPPIEEAKSSEPEPSEKTITAEENERLERLRSIARENLKKK